MSPYIRTLSCGILILLLAAYWAFLAFRQHAVMAMDFRRDMNFVEHLVVQSASASGTKNNKDIWSMALIFDENHLQLRGSMADESHMQMTRRWIAALKLSYWPSIALTAIGIVLCVPPSTRTK